MNADSASAVGREAHCKEADRCPLLSHANVMLMLTCQPSSLACENGALAVITMSCSQVARAPLSVTAPWLRGADVPAQNPGTLHWCIDATNDQRADISPRVVLAANQQQEAKGAPPVGQSSAAMQTL